MRNVTKKEMVEQVANSTGGKALTVWLTSAAGAIIAAIVAGLVYCHLQRGEPFNFTKEDGLVEWGTVVSFVGCAILAWAGAAWARGLSRRQRICLAVFAVLCFVAAGEELSWGERIFGFAPPKSMTARGQLVRFGHKDVTVHNLAFDLGFMTFSIGGVLFKLPLLLGGLFHGVLLPVALRAGKPWARRFVDKLGLFVPSLTLGVALFLGIALLYFRGLWPHSEANECREFYVPTVYFLILVEWLSLPKLPSDPYEA